MALESLPLPLLASVTAPTGTRALPRLNADRYRSAIAIAAASVFISGVGSVYISERADELGRAAAPAPAPVLAGPVADPAQAVTVPAPSRDTGPSRRWGPGSAVAEQPAPAAARTATSESARQASVSASTSSSSASRSSAGSSRTSRASGSSSGSSNSAGSSRYLVKEGDDFGSVAARLGMSPGRIAALNPGVDSSQLSIGQPLRIG